MKKAAKAVKKLLIRHGGIVAACAFAFVAISANTPCICPFYEPEEPKELGKFKKFDR